MLSLESDSEAWSGKLGKARELSRQAVESARHNEAKERAALWQANAAIREALFGNEEAAQKDAAVGASLAPGSHDAEAQTALATRWLAVRRAPSHSRTTLPSGSHKIRSFNRFGFLPSTLKWN